jgi:hypothetical protein
LIDFVEETDEFGDFVHGESVTNEVETKRGNDFGNLIGDDDNDFGDFVSPENNKKEEDDFGDFISSTDNNAAHSNMFNSAPQSNASNNDHIINNLSSLYSQAPPQSDPSNKYAALENITQQQPFNVQQPPSDIFFGMSMGTGSGNYNQGFQQPQNAFNLTAPLPGLSHQHSWTGPSQSTGFFGQNQFANQPAHPPASGFNQPFSGTNAINAPAPAPNSFNYQSNSSKQISVQKEGGDLFGLKATLQQNHKYHKYDKANSGFSMASAGTKKKDTSVFSGLVATQWKS